MRTAASKIIALGIATTTSAQDSERFIHFRDAGVHDPGVSVAAANALVSEGVASGNPQIIDMVIRGLGDLSARLAYKLPTEYGEYPVRAFSEVPGLKEFLIDHWNSQHKNTGYNVLETGVRELGGRLVNGDTLDISPDDLGLDESPDGRVDLEAVVAKVREELSPWLSIPQTLAVFWAGDADIEQFLYDVQHIDQSATKTLTTLMLLNTGKFASDQANLFREQQLAAPNTGDPSASIGVTLAAQGLALSRPAHVLPGLINAAMEHPQTRRAILVTLSGYSQDELVPHKQKIGELLKGNLGLLPMGTETEAVERLKKITGRP